MDPRAGRRWGVARVTNAEKKERGKKEQAQAVRLCPAGGVRGGGVYPWPCAALFLSFSLLFQGLGAGHRWKIQAGSSAVRLKRIHPVSTVIDGK